MAVIDALIDVYARNPADKVGGDPAYVDLSKANEGDPVFGAWDLRVARIKGQLEKTAGKQDSYKMQAKWALKYLKRLTGSEVQEDEICLRLTRLAYFPKWTDKQKAYFEATLP